MTGGAGYMGVAVAQRLLNDGHQVRVLDSLRYGGQGILGLYGHNGFSFVSGDVRDPSHVDCALEGREAVVHLAAIVGDPACANDPGLAREINLDASIRIIDSSQRAGIQRFVFASTCSNYGRGSDSESYLDEESDLNPLSLYAETKVATERTLLDVVQPDRMAVTILRFATLFGLSPRMRFDLTINQFTMELLIQKRLVVYGEQFWRPYVHVRDAARAISAVLNSPLQKVSGQVFNVGDTGQNYQKAQLIELICSTLGHQPEVEHVHVEEDPRDYRVSFEKIKGELGFKITRTVPDGIEEIINAIKNGVFTNLDDANYYN